MKRLWISTQEYDPECGGFYNDSYLARTKDKLAIEKGASIAKMYLTGQQASKKDQCLSNAQHSLMKQATKPTSTPAGAAAKKRPNDNEAI